MLIEVVGWSGSILILAAYALLSMGTLGARSVTYQLMNIFGALGLVINGWAHAALPSVFNNLVWMMIGTVAAVRIVMRLRVGGQDRLS